jgi:hypothetical protein
MNAEHAFGGETPLEKSIRNLFWMGLVHGGVIVDSEVARQILTGVLLPQGVQSG